MLPGIFVLGTPWHPRRRRSLLALASIAMLLAVGGCGGGGSSGPRGGHFQSRHADRKLNMTVTATSEALRHKQNFVLVVQ